MDQRRRLRFAAIVQSFRQICSVLCQCQGDCDLVTSSVHHEPRHNRLRATLQSWRHGLRICEAATHAKVRETTERRSRHRTFFRTVTYPAITRVKTGKPFWKNGAPICELFLAASSLNQVSIFVGILTFLRQTCCVRCRDPRVDSA
jgi:hypothetical protein